MIFAGTKTNTTQPNYIAHGIIFTLLFQWSQMVDEWAYSCNVTLAVTHSDWWHKMPICDVIPCWTTTPLPSFSASLCLDEWECPLRELAMFQYSAPPTFPMIRANGEKHVKLPWQLAGRHRVVCLLCVCDLLKESLQRKPVLGGWESVRTLPLDRESKPFSNLSLPRTLKRLKQIYGPLYD